MSQQEYEEIKRLLVSHAYYPKVVHFFKIVKIKNYFKRLLYPLFLFPVKLVTYSIYYLLIFLVRLVISFLENFWDFVSFLKARKMKEGFNLLSQKYLLYTNFEEWTNRFVDVLDVAVN